MKQPPGKATCLSRASRQAVLGIRIVLAVVASAFLAGCSPPTAAPGEGEFQGPGHFAVRGRDTYPQPPVELPIEFVIGRSTLPVPHYAYVNWIGLCPWRATRQRALADAVALSAEEIDKLFAGAAEIAYADLQLQDILALSRCTSGTGGELPIGVVPGTVTPTEPIGAYQNGRTVLLPKCYGGQAGRYHFNVLNPTVREYIIRYALKLSEGSAGIFFDNVYLDLPGDLWRWLSPVSREDAEARCGDAVNLVLSEIRTRRPEAQPPLLNWCGDAGVLEKLMESRCTSGFGGLMLEGRWTWPVGHYGKYSVADVAFYADLAERLAKAGKKLLLQSQAGQFDKTTQGMRLAAERMWAYAHLIGQPGTYLSIQGGGRWGMYPVWPCYRQPLGHAVDRRMRIENGIARRRFERETVSYRISAGSLSGVKVQRR